MRTVATALLSVAFLGATISPGWCPEPASLTTPLGSSTGATGAAVGGGPGAKNRLLVAPPPSSAAMDRLGGGSAYRPPGGGINKTGSRSGTTPMKNAQQNTPQAQPRGPVVPARPSGPDRNIDYGG